MIDLLELKKIGVQFGDKQVLKDISIKFQPGEIIGLVAPNGTGKSTLINVIMNYLPPNQGKVILNHELQYSSKANEVKIHQDVSMMPDQSDLYNPYEPCQSPWDCSYILLFLILFRGRGLRRFYP